MPPRRKGLKVLLTKQFYLWHWVSSAICLASMLLFTFTGLTLNHAAGIPGTIKTVELAYRLAAPQLELIRPLPEEKDHLQPLPALLAHHLGSRFDESLRRKEAEWSADEIYLSLPRPGGDAWLSIDRETGEVVYERTTRGTISFLNDLHKGRHSGLAWSWFIDIFAAGSLVFCVTGLFILALHAAHRPLVWPVTALGLVIPLLLALLFIH